jgi:hypothetical protein
MAFYEAPGRPRMADNGFNNRFTRAPKKPRAVELLRGVLRLASKRLNQPRSVPASTAVPTAAAKQHNENNNDEKRGDIHLRLPPNAAYCTAWISSCLTTLSRLSGSKESTSRAFQWVAGSKLRLPWPSYQKSERPPKRRVGHIYR